MEVSQKQNSSQGEASMKRLQKDLSSFWLGSHALTWCHENYLPCDSLELTNCDYPSFLLISLNKHLLSA